VSLFFSKLFLIPPFPRVSYFFSFLDGLFRLLLIAMNPMIDLNTKDYICIFSFFRFDVTSVLQ